MESVICLILITAIILLAILPALPKSEDRQKFK